MTDKLMIQLPLADVKRELQAAWEATRARLQPPKPTLRVPIDGDHAALYEVYDRDPSRVQPVVTLLALRLTADGQYSLLGVGTCTHDKARAWAIFEEWWLTFRERLPRAVTIMLQANVCLSDNGQALGYLALPVSATGEDAPAVQSSTGVGDDLTEGEERYNRIKDEVYRGRLRRKVLEQVCKGLANPQIEEKLSCGSQEVKDCISKLYKAFGINVSVMGRKQARELLADEGCRWLEWDSKK